MRHDPRKLICTARFGPSCAAQMFQRVHVLLPDAVKDIDLQNLVLPAHVQSLRSDFGVRSESAEQPERTGVELNEIATTTDMRAESYL